MHLSFSTKLEAVIYFFIVMIPYIFFVLLDIKQATLTYTIVMYLHRSIAKLHEYPLNFIWGLNIKSLESSALSTSSS